jgi:hypothetical protein
MPARLASGQVSAANHLLPVASEGLQWSLTDDCNGYYPPVTLI